MLTRALEAVAPLLAVRVKGVLPTGEDGLHALTKLFHTVQRFVKALVVLVGAFPSGLVLELRAAAFAPLGTLWSSYPEMERGLLLSDLKRLFKSIHSASHTEIPGLVEKSVSTLFTAAEASVERCMAYTGGSEGVGLLGAIGELLGEYTAQLMGALGKVQPRGAGEEPWQV